MVKMVYSSRICRLLLSALVVFLFPYGLKAKESEKVDVKIVATVDKEAYVGEAMEYEVTLMSTSPDISNVRVISAPDFTGDVTTIRGITQNTRPRKVEEKGKLYYCWTIMRNYLIPNSPGKVSIDGGKFLVFIPHEKVYYHDFWGSRRAVEYEEMPLQCNATSFKVKKLPSVPADSDFSGCVGDFRIEGWFPPGRIYPGNEAYVVFTVSGYGELSDLKITSLNKLFRTNCHLKEVERDEEQVQRDGRLFSKITLTCRFIPEEEEFEIDPLRLCFFNPETKKYYTVSSEPLRWEGMPEKKTGRERRDAIEI